ncbi:hypothetical protein AMATHDRAFT_8458 [Amanita thiersii Skay4041]|uniref:Uncharacterized protein n=1 Tax=Amanita thiersii Skay4041 TaxID=703135 RepID=A0A2A9N6W0_9AGAR|nr:hypothetical protein AMATHDRAFT_8458 [Amanita thiersii Skay4041]
MSSSTPQNACFWVYSVSAHPINISEGKPYFLCELCEAAEEVHSYELSLRVQGFSFHAMVLSHSGPFAVENSSSREKQLIIADPFNIASPAGTYSRLARDSIALLRSSNAAAVYPETPSWGIR